MTHLTAAAATLMAGCPLPAPMVVAGRCSRCWRSFCLWQRGKGESMDKRFGSEWIVQALDKGDALAEVVRIDDASPEGIVLASMTDAQKRVVADLITLAFKNGQATRK